MSIETVLSAMLTSLMRRAMPTRTTVASPQEDIVHACHALLTARGESSGIALADRVLAIFEALDDGSRAAFFQHLIEAYELDASATRDAAQRVIENGSPEALVALRNVSEPPRQELLRRLNAAPGGTARLVSLRAHLLHHLTGKPDLLPIDADMQHLLRSWFNRGFLVLSRIGWSSPAALLEKIIAYEAVHQIASWDDLKRRLAPPDRRCFAFLHPSMPGEPIIFVEVALTRGLAGSIQDILADDRKPLSPAEADTAIFYSISNCQAGLAGVSFGSFLIKQVAADLALELPNLRHFSTLSPVPGLRRWMEREARNKPDGACAAVLDADDPNDARLRKLAADYLVAVKDARARPLDSVARFHLGNGAELNRINLCADLSENGLRQSLGVMVNYLYDLDRVVIRHEAFAADHTIAVGADVRGLMDCPPNEVQPRSTGLRRTKTKGLI